MNLKIKSSTEEYLEKITKNNNILVLNSKKLLDFYYKFYKLIEKKDSTIEIFIGEKRIDTKNTILINITSFSEILNSIEFKKGTLLYEYILTLIPDNALNDSETITESLVKIAQKVINSTSINLEYNTNEDVEKMILSFLNFTLKYDIDDIEETINKLIQSFCEKNPSKIFIVFYNSSIINLELKHIDNCYSFNISNNEEINSYNLICNNDIIFFNKDVLIDRIESIFPIEFDKNKITIAIENYLSHIKSNSTINSYSEYEFLTYKILQKILNIKKDIYINGFCIHDNIKKFLEKI